MNVDIERLFRAWLDSAMPNRQGMALGRVENATSDDDGYRCAVSVLDPETLEETGEQLENVAINALWAGGDGTGVWCLPTVGQMVVIGYLLLDKALPFVVAGGIGQVASTAIGATAGFFQLSSGLASTMIMAQQFGGVKSLLVNSLGAVPHYGDAGRDNFVPSDVITRFFLLSRMAIIGKSSLDKKLTKAAIGQCKRCNNQTLLTNLQL